MPSARPPRWPNRIPRSTTPATRWSTRRSSAAGVKNPRVIEAMRNTPRHEFVPLDAAQARLSRHGPADRRRADHLAAVRRGLHDRGHRSAAERQGAGDRHRQRLPGGRAWPSWSREVYTIEIVAPLGHKAAKVLERLRYDNVHVKVGDGYQGWPEHAPFDKIIVTCSPEKVPPALVEQLREGGRMVIPVGERYQQTLYLLKKIDGKMVAEALQPTLFVPMTGKAEAGREVLPDPAKPTIEQRRLRGGRGRSAGADRLALSAAAEDRRRTRRARRRALRHVQQRRCRAATATPCKVSPSTGGR